MIRNLLTIILIVNCALSSAQFTYFNQITGDLTDEESQSATNIEVVEDGYVIWGAGIEDNILKYFIRKYNLSGEIINENVLISQNEYVLIGLTNSFKWNPFIQKFVYIHGTNLNDGTTEGYFIEFDQALNAIFTRNYSQYPPYTYPFIFEVEPDGYIVVGEYGVISNSSGSFIMKLDFEGNILWSEILQTDIYQNIYRNLNILKTETGYLIAGGGSTPETGYDRFGLITQINNFGITQSETVVEDEGALESGYLNAIRLQSGEVLMSQALSYELVNPNGNPNVFWNKIRLFKFDPQNETMYDEQTYFDDYEMKMGQVLDMVATSDGGAVILGRRTGFFYDHYSWMMKVDADLNQQWFHEYTYQSCDNCGNKLYDIELAPDGGYVAAGSFYNYDIDPRNATWLLKVDACGDEEWQGCQPVGVPEKEAQSFSVYPNPSNGRFTIEAGENENISSWSVYNLAGQKVAQGNAQSGGQSLDINLNLPSGLYALEIVQKDGKRENHKIQVVK